MLLFFCTKYDEQIFYSAVGCEVVLILSVMVISKGLLGLFEIGTLQPILFHCLYPQYIHYILHFACKMSLLHKMTTVPITLGENIVFWSLGRYPADPLSGIKIRNLKKKNAEMKLQVPEQCMCPANCSVSLWELWDKHPASCKNPLSTLNQRKQQWKCYR